MSDATLSAIAAGIKLVIVPLLMTLFVGSALGSLEMSIGEGPVDLSGLTSTLDRMRAVAFWVGIPLIVPAFFAGFYPRGSRPRMVASLVLVAGTCVWIYEFLLHGILDLSLGDATIRLDLSLLLILFVAWIAMRAMIVIAEWDSYKDRKALNIDDD